MKLITCLIQPERLPAVKQELFDAQVYKMTVSNALGAGQQAGYSETFRGVQHEVNLLKKVKIEIAVNEDYVEPTVEAIIRGARTNNIGDGKIWVTQLDDCIRIRTGERGTRAIG